MVTVMNLMILLMAGGHFEPHSLEEIIRIKQLPCEVSLCIQKKKHPGLPPDEGNTDELDTAGKHLLENELQNVKITSTYTHKYLVACAITHRKRCTFDFHTM